MKKITARQHAQSTHDNSYRDPVHPYETGTITESALQTELVELPRASEIDAGDVGPETSKAFMVPSP